MRGFATAPSGFRGPIPVLRKITAGGLATLAARFGDELVILGEAALKNGSVGATVKTDQAKIDQARNE